MRCLRHEEIRRDTHESSGRVCQSTKTRVSMTSTYIDMSSMVHFTLAPRHEDEGEIQPLISNANRISRVLFPSLNLSIGDPILP
jgi:hypothetical protein